MRRQETNKAGDGPRLWKRRGNFAPRYFITVDGFESVELPGREAGYPCPDLAWQAFRMRKAIAREIDLNGC